MIEHTQTVRRVLLTNSLSVFDHFVRLALKGLFKIFNEECNLNLELIFQLLFTYDWHKSSKNYLKKRNIRKKRKVLLKTLSLI